MADLLIFVLNDHTANHHGLPCLLKWCHAMDIL
jgi:hypothetical protein